MVQSTDWYPDWHTAHGRYYREMLLAELLELQWSGAITIWGDRDARQQQFYHIEWVDLNLPEFEMFCRWMDSQPKGLWRKL